MAKPGNLKGAKVICKYFAPFAYSFVSVIFNVPPLHWVVFESIIVWEEVVSTKFVGL